MLAAFLIRQKHLNAATAVAEVSSPLLTLFTSVIIIIIVINPIYAIITSTCCHHHNHYGGNQVRKLRPGAVESWVQEQALVNFHR